MQTVLVRANKQAEIVEIKGDLKSMQEAVGGLIEAIHLYDSYYLIFNEEGKLRGMEPNRALYAKDLFGEGCDIPDELVDIIVGPFFVVDSSGGDFVGLDNEEAQMFLERFAKPERFVRVGSRIVCE